MARTKNQRNGKAVDGGFYILSLKTKMDPVLGKAKKLYTTRFYQLKTGHGAIGTFLERIGVVESAECCWCGDKEQSVMRLYNNTQSAERGGRNADS